LCATTEAVSDAGGVDAEGYIMRSHGYWQQIPLPPEISLEGTNILALIDDEILLGMSPSLIAHVQRTEASNGLQVISPRAVTLGGIAARTAHDKRTSDMFLVGSAASRNLDWPTVDDDPVTSAFWLEPIDSYPSDPAIRPRTVSSGLVPGSRLLSDPIAKAFVTGRALVDLQRRPDVAGSADALSAALASCWGMDSDVYEDLAEASLAPTGPLLRYAIRSDDVYPTLNAPIQARKCISVGANTAGRHLYGEDAAIDWRRMRVLAESVFYQSSRLEGYTLAQMSLPTPPGNPRAPPDRAGILQMRPLPGSVWSFESRSFRLDLDPDQAIVQAVKMPARIREAVEKYHEEVRPIVSASDDGARLSFSTSLAHGVSSETGESLVAGYKTLVSKHAAFSARGKTSAAAVRGFIYECLSSSHQLAGIRALWLARYMHTTTEALNLTHMLDVRTTRHVASRMSDITSDLRVKLGVEAGRRGADLSEWWSSFASQLPREIAEMSEGSASWAIGFAHLILHPPTPPWMKLVRAMAYSSHSVMARSQLGDVRLPATIGSAERSFQAGVAVCKRLGASYGAFYAAMADITQILAARMRRAGNRMGACKMVIAGLAWEIRAKAASTVSLHASDGTSELAGSWTTRHGKYHITTSPYPAYQRWHKELNAASFVKKDVKLSFPHHLKGAVSRVFDGITSPLFLVPVGGASRAFRYVTNPCALHSDIEKTLKMMSDDTQAAMAYYDSEADEAPSAADIGSGTPEEIVPLTLDLERFKPGFNTYWDIVAKMEPLVASDLVDTVLRMDDAVAEEIEGGTYESEEELRRLVWGHEDEAASASAAARDAVI